MSRPHPEFFSDRTISIRRLNAWLRFVLSLRPVQTPGERIEWTTEGVARFLKQPGLYSEWTGEVNIRNIPYTGYNVYSEAEKPWIRVDETGSAPVITEEATRTIGIQQGIRWRRKRDQRVIYLD